MGTVPVENLLFTFDAGTEAQKYDTSTHYREVWNKPPASQKAVDVVAVQNTTVPTTAWMIEAKDFRVVDPLTPPKPSNVTGLAETMAVKASHTLAGLADAAKNAADPSEKAIAMKAISAGKTRVVLHLEPHSGAHSMLFPSGFAASVLQKLRQLVKAIDANALVLNIANTPKAGVPWSVA
jgi:hypothetical protein